MAVKQHILYLWVFILGALVSYGIVHLILSHHADNKENNANIASGVVSGKTLPDAYFFDAKGQKKTLADFNGDVVLVNLWATWCIPCVSEMPALDALQAKFADKKFDVVAVSLDRQNVKNPNVARMIAEFWGKKKITHLQTYWDKDRVLTEKWTYDGLPTSFLIGKDGVISEVFKGPVAWDKPDAQGKVAKLVE